MIYRSFSRDGVGVYRKHSYTNANIGRRIVDRWIKRVYARPSSIIFDFSLPVNPPRAATRLVPTRRFLRESRYHRVSISLRRRVNDPSGDFSEILTAPRPAGSEQTNSLSAFPSSVKQIPAATPPAQATKGNEGVKRKNEFMERSLDRRRERDPLSGRFTRRPTSETEHVLQERRDDKFNFAELADGTCKLPRNELCYIVLGVQLEFRRENRATAAVGTR